MRDTFRDYHPFTNFLFFVYVLGFAMFTMQPVCIGISFVAAIMYSVMLRGMRKVLKGLFFSIGLALILIVMNPIFNHQGITILRYLPSGNPLTYESIMYGIATAMLMLCIIQWFICFHEVMSSDKIICLFGKILPSFSLLLSMTLRFIPRIKIQFKQVNKAQQGIHRGISDGSFLSRIKNGCRIFSIVVTWSMENAIDTADSMKSRGYGLKGRSSFTMVRFELRDVVFSACATLLVIYTLIGKINNGLAYRYFPSIKGNLFTPYTISIYIAYAILNLLPVCVRIYETLYFRYLRIQMVE